MSVLTVHLPATLQDWVDSRLSQGEYADASAYLRALVDRDREKAADVAWVRQQLAAGEASGFLDGKPSEIIEDIITELAARNG